MDGPADFMLPPVMRKDQFYQRILAFGDIVAVHHIDLAVVAADRPVKCEHDGVKDRCFSRAGISGDQVQAVP